MQAIPASFTDFAQLNFGAAHLGDLRRTKRLVRATERIVQHPAGTLPEKMGSPKQLKGLYRLVKPDAVTHAAVLLPHQKQLQQRMEQHPGVLLRIHDTTELDYTGKKKSLKKLGPIGNGGRRGFLCHNTLVVDPETRELWGLANQILYCRVKAPKKEKRAKRRTRKTRESRIWKRGSEALGPIPEGKKWVDVCDRGADLFEYIDHKHARGELYVVRSCSNRWVEVETPEGPQRRKLHEHARTLPELGRKTVEVEATETQPKRTATLRLAAGQVILPPPKNPRGEHRDLPLTAYVVYVGELDPPPGVQALEWVLLSNEPTLRPEQAFERVRWYECRPIVEEFHKAQKTGCGIEKPQFTDEERLKPLIAILSVIAVLLVQIRDAGRRTDANQRQATEWVGVEHVRALSRWGWEKERSDLTIAEFCLMLARLGGHQNRKGDGMPGWLTLWRGWTQLQTMVEAVATAERVKSG